MTSETRPAPERVLLAEADDPRDLVHRTVALLAQGARVALVDPGGAGVCASALDARAVEGLNALGGVATPPTLLLRGASESSDWLPPLADSAARLLRRAWPGPVALGVTADARSGLFARLPEGVRAELPAGGTLSYQVPEHPFLRDVLKLLAGPVVYRPVAWPPYSTEDDVVRLAESAGCSLVIDSDPERLGVADSLVNVDGEGWKVVRPGSIDEATFTRMAGTIIIFVCTGNTCRSPMAEALCKVRVAERIGCAPGELESKGYVILSAGIAAMSGQPAATHAVDIVRARGGSLQSHASRKLSHDLVRQADAILTMTNDHLEALLDHVPEAAGKSRVLHPAGLDVADPVGADRETYQRTADAIERYLDQVLIELGL